MPAVRAEVARALLFELMVAVNKPDFPLVDIDVPIPEEGRDLKLNVKPGLNVLYGLNGVGKSRILDSLKNATFNFIAPLPIESGPSPALSEILWDEPGWKTWSVGHEHDMEWESKDNSLGKTYDSIQKRGSLRLKELARDLATAFWDQDWMHQRINAQEEGNEFGWEPATLFEDWMLRIGYWIGCVTELEPQQAELVGNAIREILEQGLVSARLPEEGILWTLTYFAEVDVESFHLNEYIRNTVDLLLSNEGLGSAQEYAEQPEPPYADPEDDWTREDIAQYFTDEFPSLTSLLPTAIRSHVEAIFSLQSPVKGRHRVFERKVFLRTPPIRLLADAASDINRETLETLKAQIVKEDHDFIRATISKEIERELFFGPVGSPRVSEVLQDRAKTLGEAATEEYGKLLVTAVPLRARLTEPGEWVDGDQLVWESLDRRGVWVDLSKVSDTQRRLAIIAIRVASLSVDDGLPVLVLDEPERGLHRLAELHLRRGLVELCQRFPQLVVIVASHSPSFLRPDLAQLTHVSRDVKGAVQVTALESASLEVASSLGLSVSDLLQLTRIVLLVEGAHDEWVLNGLFGDEFQAMGVRVMSMRGASKLTAAAEGQLLFDYTEAHLVVMLDNISNERASAKWNEAVVMRAAGQPFGEIEKVLRKLLPTRRSADPGTNSSTETGALKDFCLAALENDRQDRISFSTLGLADIEFYLDPKHFLVGLSPTDTVPTWGSLLAEHEKAKKQPGTKNFKTWLSDTGRAKWNQARWERAVAALDEIPEDLVEVFRTVERLHLMLR